MPAAAWDLRPQKDDPADMKHSLYEVDMPLKAIKATFKKSDDEAPTLKSDRLFNTGIDCCTGRQQ